MATKRTTIPFYGKPEQRFEKEISQVQSKMRAAGANAGEISEMLQFGTARLDNMRAARARDHLTERRSGGRKSTQYALNLIATERVRAG